MTSSFLARYSEIFVGVCAGVVSRCCKYAMIDERTSQTSPQNGFQVACGVNLR
jgi:hypothetical protein